MQQPHYRFFDLHHLNRYLIWMLIPPAILTVLGFVHGLYSLSVLAERPADLLLSSLPALEQTMVWQDGVLRFSQISLTLIVLTFFFACWLYFAKRNLIALFDRVEHTLQNSIKIFINLIIGIFFALRMMLKLWRTSTPDSHAHEAEKWLVPVWWAILIAANVCKVMAVIKLQSATTVGAWTTGYDWMLAAYSLYFPLYILTWRLAQKLARFQHAHWTQLTPQNPSTPSNMGYST